MLLQLTWLAPDTGDTSQVSHVDVAQMSPSVGTEWFTAPQHRQIILPATSDIWETIYRHTLQKLYTRHPLKKMPRFSRKMLLHGRPREQSNKNDI